MKPKAKVFPRLLALRRSSGLTLHELGAAIHIEPSTIARYERGLHPSDKHARVIESYFGAKRDSLSDGTIDRVPGRGVRERSLTRDRVAAIVSPRRRLFLLANNQPEKDTMTKISMALADLAEKGADTDVLREMVQFLAQRLRSLRGPQRKQCARVDRRFAEGR